MSTEQPRVTINEDTLNDELVERLKWVVTGTDGTIHVTTDEDDRGETFGPGDVDVARRIPDAAQHVRERFWEKVNVGAPVECWEWQYGTIKGYGAFRLNDQKTAARAHRVAYRMEVGPIPASKQVNHHCDNPGCVNPNHLYLGTQAENARDSYARNRRGELTNEVVREIRRRAREEDVTYAELGEDYGVSGQSIGAVVRRDTYDYID